MCVVLHVPVLHWVWFLMSFVVSFFVWTRVVLHVSSELEYDWRCSFEVSFLFEHVSFYMYPANSVGMRCSFGVSFFWNTCRFTRSYDVRKLTWLSDGPLHKELWQGQFLETTIYIYQNQEKQLKIIVASRRRLGKRYDAPGGWSHWPQNVMISLSLVPSF